MRMQSKAMNGFANSTLNARIILMLKYPRRGEVKTRLIPALGERRACELYRAMVRQTLDEVQGFVEGPDLKVGCVHFHTLAPRGTSGERAGERGNPGDCAHPRHEPERGALLRQSAHNRCAEQCSALRSGHQCADFSGNSRPESERLISPSFSSIPNGGEGGNNSPGVLLEVRVAGSPNAAAVRDWLGDAIHFRLQGDGDLGQRMERALEEAFAEGASSVVVIGADCPGLTARHLDAAFRALDDNDAVLGPAVDGGYYLVGVRRFLPDLFRNIPWSTESVLEETLVAANRAGIECELLDTLHDLDVPDDLPFWAQSSQARAAGKGKVSVIIPTLNEARELPRVLEAAQRGQPYEIIVVDGGSTDETVGIARSMDTVVLSAPRCRAVQMNRGAAVANGEYLLFLHADTLLPVDYLGHVLSVLDKPGVVGGAFKFSISGDFSGRRLVESTTNWRARRRQLPYGDQALFLRREVFDQVGGFPEMPIMEDYEFVHRLKRLGRVVIAPSPAVTSGRRWRQHGWLWPTILNKIIILAYHCGVSPTRLARWYRGCKAKVGSPPLDVSGSPKEVLGINRPPGRSHL